MATKDEDWWIIITELTCDVCGKLEPGRLRTGRPGNAREGEETKGAHSPCPGNGMLTCKTASVTLEPK